MKSRVSLKYFAKYYSEISLEWENFTDFKRDMYESYVEHVASHGEKGTTIDRIDWKGNYSKENCRWATRKEQSRNRRDVIMMTLGGVTKPTTQWAEENGLRHYLVRTRLKSGWTPEQALMPIGTTIVSKQRRVEIAKMGRATQLRNRKINNQHLQHPNLLNHE